MIKTEITIKGITYTVRAKTQDGIQDAIKQLKKLNRKKKDGDEA